jgi:hypothetical protein
MRAYSFLNTVVLINGVELNGFADGDDAINITRRVDSGSDKVGADGSMMVSLSADKSGEFTFKLLQTSSSNKYLASVMALQEGGAKTFVPCTVLFQDTYRNDLATGTIGYMKKPADVTRGVQGNIQEWTIVVERLDMLLGDPALVGIATGVAAVFGA